MSRPDVFFLDDLETSSWTREHFISAWSSSESSAAGQTADILFLLVDSGASGESSSSSLCAFWSAYAVSKQYTSNKQIMHGCVINNSYSWCLNSNHGLSFDETVNENDRFPRSDKTRSPTNWRGSAKRDSLILQRATVVYSRLLAITFPKTFMYYR